MKNNYQNDEFLRKRQERQKKIRKRRAKIAVVFVLILLLAVGAVLSVTVLFPIENIRADGSKIYTAEQIIESCGVEKGENLIIASEDKALESLKKKLPFVETVDFDRTLPDTLKIKVTDAKEYACYKVDDEYFTVSKSGWVLKSYTEPPKNITLVISDKVKAKVGTALGFTDTSVEELAVSITDCLSEYDLTVEYVDITDKIAVEAKVDGRFIVNFGSSKDLEPKVKHLKSMMEKLGENATGKINLSMWSSQNAQGSFVQTDIK